jgi:uncharacterized protein YeaO (DUF488 family)
VPKAEFASRGYYDVWLPELSPSAELVRSGQQASDERAWRAFEKAYRREMKEPAPDRLLQLLAALSRQADFSVGCYCEREERCHRSILRQLLAGHGASLAEGRPRVAEGPAAG